MKQIMDQQEIEHAITRVAMTIIENHKELSTTMILGIRTRGEYLAKRLTTALERLSGIAVPCGVMDITLYRDDLSMANSAPVFQGNSIPFPVQGKRIILVDDVIFTARTLRSAMYAVMDQGRPQSIEVFALIDRGHNELPLYARYKGKHVQTSRSEEVLVKLSELDGEDSVWIHDPNQQGA
ncbi:bifunctional pyr operon transcriptional regulator/uracil phosphoribosyltransferase PyrR [Chrysiogenes arsenatis]|uniref:bifunctional pyr operon transcriptional regulator/uracil phosphoribosyltransferase PyrR n=1 Tax=Chrysiogenes arsenatis TaxID=309797 RepID=UPI00040E1900|nr:bifunctional pyr operon transcriptional regulator/uracil phosphoribosyltransferase PyrR [Chrysiogenes arsenatis]